MRRQPKGFTLIELMIVVAIIGILAAIVYPSYVEYVQRSWRGTSQGCLLEVAQGMERVYTTNTPMAYPTAAATYPNPSCITDNGLDDRYTISIAATTTTFTVSAVPKDAQSGDRCGTLTVDQTGAKNVTGGTETDPNACW